MKIGLSHFNVTLISILILRQLAGLAAHAQSAPLIPRQAAGTLTILNGFIVGASLTNDGGGYPAIPAVSVTDVSGSNAVIAASLSGEGAVTNLTVKNAGSHYSARATLSIAAPPTNANTTDITLILGQYVTDNIRTWTSGTNYPSGGFYTNYAGITFYLSAFPGITNGLGSIFTGLGSAATPSVTNFPVNITNAVTVYTIMNSEWGKLGATNGTVDLYGAQGAHASFNIVQGVNIRDHYNGNYQNTVASNVMSLYFGANKTVRLDCQGWMLPTNFFSQTLTNIQINSFGNTPNGVPVVEAVTVRTAGPALAADTAGGQVRCYWPSTPTNYVLQTANVLTPAAWTNVSYSATITNNQCTTVYPATNASQLFRLFSLP